MNSFIANVKIQNTFNKACNNGELEKAKKMFSKYPNIDIDWGIFSNACYNGFLELAKWLLSVKPHINCDSGFISACRKGYLEIAQWIFSVNRSVIENDNDYTAFSFACFYGKLHIAQWLLSIATNIDNKKEDNNNLYDDTFKVACGNATLNIAQWITTLKPYRYNLEINEEGEIVNYYVRNPREINWLKRRIPLLAYNLESYNIFQQLNTDIIREICLFV